MSYAQRLQQGLPHGLKHQYGLLSDFGLPLDGISPTQVREALSQSVRHDLRGDRRTRWTRRRHLPGRLYGRDTNRTIVTSSPGPMSCSASGVSGTPRSLWPALS
jgi:hypothetical protein